MHSLLITFTSGIVGLISIAFGFLYKQDQYPSSVKWYQVLGKDLGVRITFWVIGLAFLAYSGFIQFML